MALSEQQLAGILGNAKKLCNPEADRVMNEYRGVNANQKKGSEEHENYRTWENTGFDDVYAGGGSTRLSQSAPQQQIMESSGPNRSRLPEAIKKSMMENQYQLHDMTEEGKLESAISSLSQRQRQVVNEAYSQPQTQNAVIGGGIDSNYLKFLIKESLKEYFSEKGTLNEGTTLRQIGLSEGKIKLVDNKGNIYSAQLELTGNVRDKKKN